MVLWRDISVHIATTPFAFKFIPCSMRRFAKALEEFVALAKDFAVVYSSSRSPLILRDTARVCILDSLFNPPHKAHYALAREALSYRFGDTHLEKNQLLLLLLLLVKNADKVDPQPASFEHRLDMMHLMADYLHDNLKVDVSIGLTLHAKFVDKLVSIMNDVRERLPESDVKLTFLVGFDTLLRIFDPKYYLPDKLLDLLNEFMRTTDLFCLTRQDNVNSYQNQVDYVRRIRHGKIAHIPQAWSDAVHIFSFEKQEDIETLGSVSSSAVRKAIAEDPHQELPLIPQIKDYILENKLYQ